MLHQRQAAGAAQAQSRARSVLPKAGARAVAAAAAPSARAIPTSASSLNAPSPSSSSRNPKRAPTARFSTGAQASPQAPTEKTAHPMDIVFVSPHWHFERARPNGDRFGVRCLAREKKRRCRFARPRHARTRLSPFPPQVGALSQHPPPYLPPIIAPATTTGRPARPPDVSANLLALVPSLSLTPPARPPPRHPAKNQNNQVSAEQSPWSKTGGLGDVVGGLPIELAKRGHRVMAISPRYDQYSDAWDTSVVVEVDGEPVRFFHTHKKGVDRVFIDHPSFLAKVWGKTGSKIYGSRSGADYLDNPRRFALFCKAALAAIGSALPFAPGPDAEGVVIVANDWHSALVPVLVKEAQKNGGVGAPPGLKGAKTALVVHNIAFQGRFFREAFADMGVSAATEPLFAFEDGYSRIYDEKNPMDDDAKPFDNTGGAMYSKINWLKAGILTADELVTVSPAYAAEISQPGKGVELDGIINARGRAVGIVNGMDVAEWDPSSDKFLDVNYGAETVHEGKAAAKAALQAELGLPVDPAAPLFGVIGRLEEQKGTDILLSALPSLPANAQVAILGTGKAKYEAMLKAADGGKFGPNVKAVVQFSAPLAHQINAGADFLIVPSRFEPCGLIQLHAMRYGTVPIVASTGGLVDTVQEGKTGFHIGALNPDALDAADAGALAATVARAAQVYGTPAYKKMVEACIGQDLSWAGPARKWEGVLEAMQAGGSAKASGKAASVKTPVEAL